MADIGSVVATAPTVMSSCVLRWWAERFGVSGRAGHMHQSVDIVANQSDQDKSIYQVRATSDGPVAYAQINGSASAGFGYTIVIDYQNGFYTLYAHRAINASSGQVTMGQAVSQGDIIGYLADIANGKNRQEMCSPMSWPLTIRPNSISSRFRRQWAAVPPVRSKTSRTGARSTAHLRLQALGYESF